jgi:hypothetical protein
MKYILYFWVLFLTGCETTGGGKIATPINATTGDNGVINTSTHHVINQINQNVTQEYIMVLMVGFYFCMILYLAKTKYPWLKLVLFSVAGFLPVALCVTYIF